MLNIIVAPRSHNSTAEKHIKKIAKYLKINKEEFSVYFLHSLLDMPNVVREITSLGENEFIIIGDDIVINEFLNSTKDVTKIKLGIIPTSKKDDFASYIGLPCKPIQAIKEILERNIVQTDLLLVNDIKVLNCLIVGASVDVWNKYSQFKIKNTLSEQIALAKYAPKFEGEHLTLTTKNGKIKTEHIYELVVANGGKSKGKLVSPLSNVTDGLFNLSYSLFTEKNENIKNLKLFNSGRHIYSENTKQHWLNNLKITNEINQIQVIIDGKLHNLEKLDISLIENGLKLYKK